MNTSTFAQDMELAYVQPEGQEQKKQVPARMLEYAPDRYVALPPHTTLEIVEDPDIIPVPGAAPHALGLLFWQERWLPVIDLGRLLHETDTSAESPDTGKPRHVLVVACQRMPGHALEYGAIALPVLPETIFIGNEASCALPEDNPLWPQISLSCFTYKDSPTPIVDTGRLFGRSYG